MEWIGKCLIKKKKKKNLEFILSWLPSPIRYALVLCRLSYTLQCKTR